MVLFSGYRGNMVLFSGYLARFGSSLLAQRRGKPFNLLCYPLIKIRRGTTHLGEKRQGGGWERRRNFQGRKLSQISRFYSYIWGQVAYVGKVNSGTVDIFSSNCPHREGTALLVAVGVLLVCRVRVVGVGCEGGRCGGRKVNVVWH